MKTRTLLISASLPLLALSLPLRAGEAPGKPPEPATEPAKEEKKDLGKDAKTDETKDAPDLRPQDRFSRETPDLLKGWEPALDGVRRATVRLVREGKQIALGCAVHEDGYVLTKASEVHDKKGAFLTNLEAQFSEGLRLPVKLADLHRTYDLALLKVSARGLRPMPWDEAAVPAPGAFLAAAQPERLPLAAGVLSVKPRSMDESQKGYLGVELEVAEGGVKVKGVDPSSPAALAGLVMDDLIKSIDGKQIASVTECIDTITALKPYRTVKILIMRDKKEQEVSATLAPRRGSSIAEDPRSAMSGALSRNRQGYPDAMQHDMVLEPNEVGGPLVDLDGRVVGMNIARSGRIECFAIPSATLRQLLSKAGEGKLYHPELDALREERKNAEAAMERVKKDLEALGRRIQEAEKAPEKTAAKDDDEADEESSGDGKK